MPGYASPVSRVGLVAGSGVGWSSGRGGRGWRNWFCATGLPGWMRCGVPAAPHDVPEREAEKRALKYHAEALQAELDIIKKRLDELEPDAKAQ